MVAIFEPLFTKLKHNHLPVSAIRASGWRLRPFVKSIKSEPMGSSKMLQEFETKVSSFSLRPG